MPTSGSRGGSGIRDAALFKGCVVGVGAIPDGDAVVVADDDDEVDVANFDETGVADREDKGAREVLRVPTVIVAISVFREEERVRLEGMGMVDVADGRGEANDPDIWSSLKSGEKPSIEVPLSFDTEVKPM